MFLTFSSFDTHFLAYSTMYHGVQHPKSLLAAVLPCTPVVVSVHFLIGDDVHMSDQFVTLMVAMVMT